MKTIKVIDLLNKIANGKPLPKLRLQYSDDDDIGYELYQKLGETSKDDFYRYLNEHIEILDEEDEFEDIKPLVLKTFERTGQAVTIDRLADYYFDNFKLIENALAKVILNQKKIIERLKKEGK